MKLTTKLLKEMIQQEMTKMQYGGDNFEMPQKQYVLVDENGIEKSITPEEYMRLVATNKYSQSDIEGTNITQIQPIPAGALKRMSDDQIELDNFLDGLTPEERKYAGL